MSERIRFNSLTELQEKYPVGSVLATKVREWTTTKYFYNKQDVEFLKKTFVSVEPVDDVTCFCKQREIIRKVVDGYVYDGKYWYPAYETWGGWQEYMDYDLKEEDNSNE